MIAFLFPPLADPAPPRPAADAADAADAAGGGGVGGGGGAARGAVGARSLWRLYAHVSSSAVQHSPPAETGARVGVVRPYAVLLLPSLHLSSNALPA